MEIETEDVYKDMGEDLFHYDMRNYPKDHLFFIIHNKKVLGKMKDKCPGRVINEVVAIRPKMYSIIENQENIKKVKGVKKNVVKKEIQHEQYKEALFERKQFCHGMKTLRSEGHEIYSMHVDKVSLSTFDTKRWIKDQALTCSGGSCVLGGKTNRSSRTKHT